MKMERVNAYNWMLVVSPHNQATPTLPRTMGWWDFWWTALSQQWSWAALPQQWSSRASSSGSRLTPTLPSRTLWWAAGISDGPHCHNNGLGPQVTPMVLIARLFTLLALSPHYCPLGLTILSPHSECGCAASCVSTSLCAATCGAQETSLRIGSALTSNVHEQRRNINKNKMAAAFRTKMAAVSHCLSYVNTNSNGWLGQNVDFFWMVHVWLRKFNNFI